jgi:hypothetical protein
MRKQFPTVEALPKPRSPKMKQIWKRIAFFAIANMLALTAQANALEVGEIIHFNSPYPLEVGCVDPDLAGSALQMKHRYAAWQIEDFVNYNSLNVDKDNRLTGCVILNRKRTDEWEVIRKQQSPGNLAGWFCVIGTADFSTGPKSREQKPDTCFWTFLVERPRRASQ